VSDKLPLRERTLEEKVDLLIVKVTLLEARVRQLQQPRPSVLTDPRNATP